MDSTRRVVTPFASLGVIVIVALSPLATDALVDPSVKEAGAQATVQVTVVETELTPGALVASVSCPAPA